MGRHICFDWDKALDASIDLFWEKGYEATSIGDVAQRLNLTTGSIYNSFGKKHNLYQLTIDRYYDLQTARIKDALKSGRKPLSVLNETMLILMTSPTTKAKKYGSLDIASLSELKNMSPVTDRSKAFHKFLDTSLRSVVEEGQKKKAIRKDMPPKAIVSYLKEAANGIALHKMSGALSAKPNQSIDLALEAVKK